MGYLSRFRFGQLSARFAARVILFSSVLALLITGGELAYEYARDLRQIDSRMAQIEDAYLPSVIDNLWVYDRERIDTLLQGIVRLPDFVLAEVRVNGRTEFRRGQELRGPGVTHAFPLRYRHLGREQLIGELVVAATYEGAQTRMVQRALYFLVSNGAKTVLVALFIIVIFYRLVGRHIEQISFYAHKHSSPGETVPELTLKRKPPRRPDELSELALAFNHQRRELLRYHDAENRRAEQLAEQVRQRTLQISEQLHALKQAKEESDWANRAKFHFLASMNHEFRTPLNAIHGFAHLIAETSNDPQTKENAGDILDGGRRLLELVDNMVQLSASEVPPIGYQLEPVDARALLRQEAQAILALLATRGMKLEFEEEGPNVDYRVRADAGRLGQALLHYVSNALKYGREQGNVRVCLSRRADQVRIAIRDDGPGIAQERLQELFMPFNRLGYENSTVPGAGLGLAIAREIIEFMGGRVGAASQPGQGATFWIELPAVSDHADQAGL